MWRILLNGQGQPSRETLRGSNSSVEASKPESPAICATRHLTRCNTLLTSLHGSSIQPLLAMPGAATWILPPTASTDTAGTDSWRLPSWAHPPLKPVHLSTVSSAWKYSPHYVTSLLKNSQWLPAPYQSKDKFHNPTPMAHCSASSLLAPSSNIPHAFRVSQTQLCTLRHVWTLLLKSLSIWNTWRTKVSQLGQKTSKELWLSHLRWKAESTFWIFHLNFKAFGKIKLKTSQYHHSYQFFFLPLHSIFWTYFFSANIWIPFWNLPGKILGITEVFKNYYYYIYTG